MADRIIPAGSDFAVYVLMAAIGIIASIAGEGPLFYCTVYCKIGIALVIAIMTAVLFSQVSFSLQK